MKKYLLSITLPRRRMSLILLGLLATTPAWAETLQQAWDVTLGANHSLSAAQENTAASEQQLKAAKSARLPGLALEAGYTALDNAPEIKTGFGSFAAGEEESLSYKATATVPIYTSGRISSGIDAAEASLKASRAQVSSKILDLKLEVAEAFVNVLRAARGLEVANSHVTSLQAHTTDIQNMFDQGMVARNDLLAAQVTQADAQQQAIQATNALDLARATYNRLLGRPLGQEVILDDLLLETVSGSLSELTERAIKQRTELMVLANQIIALRHQVTSIRAETEPQVALSGGYGYQENQYQVHEDQWSVNIGMQWNLFDGGVVRHRASATERQAAALQEQHDDLVSNISLQVRKAWLDIQATNKRILVTNAAIAYAEEKLKENRDRYERKLTTNNEVLDAETLRTRSQKNHANARYDAVLAGLRLKRAVGDL